jgi:hypothetical protein
LQQIQPYIFPWLFSLHLSDLGSSMLSCTILSTVLDSKASPKSTKSKNTKRRFNFEINFN